MVGLADKVGIEPGSRPHAGKAYCSKKHQDALKARGIKNGIQDKAAKDKPLSPRQLARNKATSKVRFVVDAPLAANSVGLAEKSCVTQVWSKPMPGTSCGQSLIT